MGHSMIYELRTYDFKPGTLPEVEKRFGEDYDKKRKKHSELAAIWRTHIGPLNQLVHIWPYHDLEERERVRAAAYKDGWPPRIAEFRLGMRSDIMIPFPNTPALKPGRMGPYFEMCTCTYVPGELPAIMELWEAALPARLKLGPLCGVWYTDIGELNTFVHIWPFQSFSQRDEIRAKAGAAGLWPPSVKSDKDGGGYKLLARKNTILIPASFSPLQ